MRFQPQRRRVWFDEPRKSAECPECGNDSRSVLLEAMLVACLLSIEPALSNLEALLGACIGAMEILDLQPIINDELAALMQDYQALALNDDSAHT